MIEEGDPHLERARHARRVGVAQQALTEVAPQLEHRDGRERTAAIDQVTELLRDLAGQADV